MMSVPGSRERAEYAMLRELIFLLLALFFLAALLWTRGKPEDWSPWLKRMLSRDTFRATCVVAFVVDLLILATLLVGWRV